MKVMVIKIVTYQYPINDEYPNKIESYLRNIIRLQNSDT